MAVNYGVEGGGGGASGDSPAPSPPPPVTLTTTEAIVPYLPAFHDLLLNPPKVSGSFSTYLFHHLKKRKKCYQNKQ